MFVRDLGKRRRLLTTQSFVRLLEAVIYHRDYSITNSTQCLFLPVYIYLVSICSTAFYSLLSLSQVQFPISISLDYYTPGTLIKPVRHQSTFHYTTMSRRFIISRLSTSRSASMDPHYRGCGEAEQIQRACAEALHPLLRSIDPHLQADEAGTGRNHKGMAGNGLSASRV